MMNKIATLLAGSAALATFTAAMTAPAQAATLTNDPDCTVAVFAPDYTACQGAYELARGENDVTNGDSSNVVTQLLNEADIFGQGIADWTFLSKTDTPSGGTSGVIDLADFLKTGYDVAISFKAADSFSIYWWAGDLGTDLVSWSTAGTATNDNGRVQGLSHYSVYYRPVPEPLTLLGTAAALGLGAVMRRRTEEA
jgi:hypothetical protein